MSDETEKLTTEHIIAAKSLMNEAQVPKDAISNMRGFIEVGRGEQAPLIDNGAMEIIAEKLTKAQALVDAASEISCKLKFDVKPKGMDNELRELDEAIVSCEEALTQWNKLLIENISRDLHGVVFHEDAIDSTKATAKEALEEFEKRES